MYAIRSYYDDDLDGNHHGHEVDEKNRVPPFPFEFGEGVGSGGGGSQLENRTEEGHLDGVPDIQGEFVQLLEVEKPRVGGENGGGMVEDIHFVLEGCRDDDVDGFV